MDYAAFIGTLGIVIGVAWLLAAWLAWRWTWVIGWLKGSVITGLFGTGALLGMMASDLSYWQRAGEDLTVAHISIDRGSDPIPVVSIKTLGGGSSHTLSVNGDFLDLQFQTLQWSGVLEFGGLSYRLVSAQSRVDAIENNLNWSGTAEKTYSLPYESGVMDLWQASTALKPLRNLVKPGTLRVNYIPVQDGALFAVIFRDGKLVLEAQNDAAVKTATL